MRLPLNCRESEYLKPIYDSYVQKEDTLDYVIPDTCADVKKILDVRGQLLVLSKKASEDRVIICMSVKADVIYEPDGGGEIQRVSTTIAADRTITVASADYDTLISADAGLCFIDARTVNPRKLNIRCEVGVRLRCFNRATSAVCSGGEDCSSVCLLQKCFEDFVVTDIKEKYFSVSDEYKIPEDKPRSASLLSYDTTVNVLEVKAVGNKLIFKSAAETKAIFMCRETGRLFDAAFTSVFSQLIEIENCGENVGYTVRVLVSDSALTPCEDAEGMYRTEISVAAQAVFTEKRVNTYIADAYSNVCEIDCEVTEIEYSTLVAQKCEHLTLRGRLPICAELTELCYLSAASVCAAAENGAIRLDVLLSGVGRDEEGGLAAPRLRLSESLETACGEGCELRLTSVSVSPTQISPGFEVCLEADVEYLIVCRKSVTAVSGIEANEDCPCCRVARPSVTVLCVDRGEELWNIAKRCGSTVELISCANTVDGVFDEKRRPLLIPKA